MHVDVISAHLAGTVVAAHHLRHEVEAWIGISGVVVLLLLVINVVAAIRIVQKAGYSGVLAIIWFIPLVNFVALLVFALVEWPVQKQARGEAVGYQQPSAFPTPTVPQGGGTLAPPPATPPGGYELS